MSFSDASYAVLAQALGLPLPDFIVRLDNAVRLILDTKGHDPLEDVAQAAERRRTRRFVELTVAVDELSQTTVRIRR